MVETLHRAGVSSTPTSAPSAPGAYSCPKLQKSSLINTQCEGMWYNNGATTAFKCEESCCDSEWWCKTWLFNDRLGVCYQTSSKCKVNWLGVGGASGWSGSSAYAY